MLQYASQIFDEISGKRDKNACVYEIEQGRREVHIIWW
jgi:hypothetical protein